MKRIVICADGTWNKPEKDPDKDIATNVLRTARAIKPVASDGTEQVVFYDWGLGSYHASVTAGAFGDGINKNIQDNYRFIVQNYKPGDELYFFGFSRGAYTVRSLAGFINNCGILRRPHARRIAAAYEDIYKNTKLKPSGKKSREFRAKYSVQPDVKIRFVGVWDTVGALGIPIRMLGFMNEKHLFHDAQIGRNIEIARHALAIDERRDDFAPTIWEPNAGMDLQQVWFAGVHSDVGGGYKADKRGRLLSDIPLEWMLQEAGATRDGVKGLEFEPHLRRRLKGDVRADQNESYEGFIKVMGEKVRGMKKRRDLSLHSSVKERWEKRKSYRPDNLKKFVKKYGWGQLA